MPRFVVLMAILPALALLTLVCDAGEAEAQTWGSDGFYEQGTFGFGLGMGLRTYDEVTGIKENSDGSLSTVTETHFGGSALVGVSYALIPRIALDVDTGFMFDVTPEFEFTQVAVTPGTRLFVVPGLYGRLAAMNFVMDPINSLALVGAGYFTSTDSVSFFIELNYVAWAWKDDDNHPVPKIIPRMGVSIGL